MLDQLAAALYTAGVPNPGGGSPPPGGEKLTTIISWVAWGATAICVMGVIVCGARMAISHRHGSGGEHASALGWVLAGCVLVGTASGLVGALV